MSAQSTGREPIVIVGLACCFPGGANTPSKLWDLVCQRPDVQTAIPPERFNSDAFYSTSRGKPGYMDTKLGYLLSEDIRVFDAAFFKINPLEAEAMGPNSDSCGRPCTKPSRLPGFHTRPFRDPTLRCTWVACPATTTRCCSETRPAFQGTWSPGQHAASYRTASPTSSTRWAKLEQALPEPPAWSLIEQCLADPSVSRVGEAAISKPLCTAVQLMLVDLLRLAGVVFSCYIGHSSGEIAAAYAAGFLCL